MRSWKGYVYWAGCAAALSSAASADPFTLLDQIRETQVFSQLSASEVVLNDFDFEDAPGFGAFNSNIDASVALGAPTDSAAWADQASDITTTAISGEGSATIDTRAGAVGTTLADAYSTFTVEFSIAANTPYTLIGLLESAHTADASSQALLQFDGPGGPVHSLSNINSGSDPFNFAGMLTPGTYTLAVVALASTGEKGEDAASAWQFELVVPEPGSAALLGLLMAGALRRPRR